MRGVTRCMAVMVVAVATRVATAQPYQPSRVSLTFDHFYDYDEMSRAMHDLAGAYPELLSLRSIGKSQEGRDLWLMTLNNPRTGADTSKPAMYIDGNIHGNEVQAAEVALYT